MTDYRHDQLWLKLSFLNLNAAASVKPLLRLIEERTGWTEEMAARVIEEYRRFLFLALRAGHAVTPPVMVNEVWMLHLENALNYWETLGQLIAERPVADAGPVQGQDNYRMTMASYARVFGAAPPGDIWTSQEEPGILDRIARLLRRSE